MAWCGNGAEANALIDAGLIKVNGVTEHRKRNKLKIGAIIQYKNNSVTIE
jgi:ribosome-associated protein YbcJ (S4-like RNA binding protein)